MTSSGQKWPNDIIVTSWNIVFAGLEIGGCFINNFTNLLFFRFIICDLTLAPLGRMGFVQEHLGGV